MKKNKKSNESNIKKVYRLVILDEYTLKERISLLLTKQNIFIYGGSILIAIVVLVGLLFIFTPMKYLLPPVDNYKLENQIVKNSILIDSLKREIQFRDNYFQQVQNILNKRNIEKYQYSDSIQQTKLLTKKEQDSIMAELIKREQEALDDIIKEQKVDIKKENFYKPVDGVISNKFDASKGHFGVDIVAQEGTPVVSVLSGTVILATWSVNNGYIIEIQHSNNLISVYKHNGELLKREGDKVSTGEPIALVGNTGENTTGPHLHFELWKNGIAVDPQNFINF